MSSDQRARRKGLQRYVQREKARRPYKEGDYQETRGRQPTVSLAELRKDHAKTVIKLYRKHGVETICRLMTQELGRVVSFNTMNNLIKELAAKGKVRKRLPNKQTSKKKSKKKRKPAVKRRRK